MQVVHPFARWYRRRVPARFWPVEEDRERAEFRRRLGVTLARVRRKLTAYRTQQSIADALQVDRETIGRWERGEREPKVFDLSRLWARYGVPGDWFLDPTANVNELDRRIAGLRALRLREAASEAARDEAGEGPALTSGGGTAPRTGRRQPRRPPRSLR